MPATNALGVHRMRTALTAWLIIWLSLAPVTGAHAQPVPAPMIVVTVDQTTLYRLPEAAGEIVIGNPSIVDVAIVGPQLLALTGKTHGVSNLIVHSIKGVVLLDTRVSTRGPTDQVVRLLSGAGRRTFACAPYCNPMVQVQDAPEFFDTITKQASQKDKLRESAGASRSSQQLFPCDSPNQRDSAGRRCGGRSAYNREGGRKGYP